MFINLSDAELPLTSCLGYRHNGIIYEERNIFVISYYNINLSLSLWGRRGCKNVKITNESNQDYCSTISHTSIFTTSPKFKEGCSMYIHLVLWDVYRRFKDLRHFFRINGPTNRYLLNILYERPSNRFSSIGNFHTGRPLFFSFFEYT